MIETETRGLTAGDVVELVDRAPGTAKRFAPGAIGEVLVGSDGQEFGWCTVAFTGVGGVYRVAPRHLRRVGHRPPPDVEDSSGATTAAAGASLAAGGVGGAAPGPGAVHSAAPGRRGRGGDR